MRTFGNQQGYELASKMAVCLVLVLVPPPSIWAAANVPVANQSAPSSAPTSPIPSASVLSKKPATILQLALETNGLDYRAATPWHIQLSYEEFDEEGDKDHSGTFEEYYVGPRKYKQIYVRDALTQMDFASASGLYRTGNQNWATPVELQIQQEALSPLYRSQLGRKNTKLDKIDWAVGTTLLPCVVIRRMDITISNNGLPKFCFDPDSTRLRYTRGKGWDETFYNNIEQFQDRNVAKEITITRGGKPYLKIHVGILEPLPHADDALFTPPPGSSRIAGRIKIPSSVLDDYVLSRGSLSGNREPGKVDVNFVVGKDGRVIEAIAIDGPKNLQKSALKAMGQYRFRPFLVLGDPVEVASSVFFEVY